MLKGGCFCGKVRYEADGESWHATACHCSICRRTSAAPFVAWFTVKPEAFRIVAGEPRRFRSSDRATRTFCPSCGTPLTFQSESYPEEIDVTTCSLDDPEQVPPESHTWRASGLSWVKSADGLPVYPEKRPE
ncbi:MAG: glutathione-dependent formaldehyde-activating [Reyranella sp.]|nr:glutathione-dependent formaldehyde-activating [Reyranella sp.]